MQLIVFHVVSGQSLFTGAVLLLCAAGMSLQKRRWVARLVVPATCLGGMLVLVSSTALPSLLTVLVTIATSAWIGSVWKTRWRQAAVKVMCVSWLLVMLWEIPYCIAPRAAPVTERGLTLIGDSLSAGTGEQSEGVPWPVLLQQEHKLDVQNLAHMGSTTAAALNRVRTEAVAHELVLIEIGGNDLLGSTSATQFAADLDALLAAVTCEGRQVLMFELPLPPLAQRYSFIQRKLARKHGVQLIPKRVLLSAIAGPKATLDGLHLTAAGHTIMADQVWRIIQPALP